MKVGCVCVLGGKATLNYDPNRHSCLPNTETSYILVSTVDYLVAVQRHCVSFTCLSSIWMPPPTKTHVEHEYMKFRVTCMYLKQYWMHDLAYLRKIQLCFGIPMDPWALVVLLLLKTCRTLLVMLPLLKTCRTLLVMLLTHLFRTSC